MEGEMTALSAVQFKCFGQLKSKSKAKTKLDTGTNHRNTLLICLNKSFAVT